MRRCVSLCAGGMQAAGLDLVVSPATSGQHVATLQDLRGWLHKVWAALKPLCGAWSLALYDA